METIEPVNGGRGSTAATQHPLDLIFIGKVLANLLFHTAVTATVAYNTQHKRISYKWIYVVASIFMLVIISYIPPGGHRRHHLSFYVKVVLFILLAYVNGIVLSGVLKHIPDRELKELFVQTVLVFVSMIIVGYYFHKWQIEITPLYYFVLLFSFTTTTSLLYYTLMDTSVRYKKNIRLSIVLLTTVFIIISTYNTLSKDYEQDIIHATLDYYTSFLNVFTNLSANDAN